LIHYDSIESETHCRLDSKECFIAFSYGDKIPVKNLEFSIGGNAANNAVGTERLGISSGNSFNFGQDSVGEMIVSRLKTEGVRPHLHNSATGNNFNYSTII